MPTRKYTLDAATLRRLAVLADVDPRTIRKVLDGAAVRGMTGQRVRAVLLAQGYLHDQPIPEVDLGRR